MCSYYWVLWVLPIAMTQSFIIYFICKYFFPVCGFLSHSLNSVFLTLMKPNNGLDYTFLSFNDYTFHVIAKKILLGWNPQRFSHVFFYKFYGFRFKNWVFDWFWVTLNMTQSMVQSFLFDLHVDTQFFLYHFLKGHPFSTELPLHICRHMWGSIPWLSVSISLSMFTIPHHLDGCSYNSWKQVGSICSFSKLFLLFQVACIPM